jgi:hypothetical protein
VGIKFIESIRTSKTEINNEIPETILTNRIGLNNLYLSNTADIKKTKIELYINVLEITDFITSVLLSASYSA